VSGWTSKCKLSEPGEMDILDKHRDGRPVTVTDEIHRSQVDELIKNDPRITQNRTADIVGTSQKRVGFIYSAAWLIERSALVEYRKR